MSGIRSVLLLAVTLAALLSPTPARAQGPGNPLAPGLPQSPATVPTTTTPTVITATNTSSSSGGGLGGSGAIVIAIGALVVIGGIWLFILRDARRRAPVRHHTAAAEGGTASWGSKSRPKPRKLSPAERRRRKRGRAR